jgi:murein DD-endopeptidase MepM/ murein hydrolase activator NlpD
VVESKNSGRRRALAEPATCSAAELAVPRRFAGQGRYAAPLSASALSRRVAELAEARALGAAVLEQNPTLPVMAEPVAVPSSRRQALAAERAAGVNPVRPVPTGARSRREAREAAPVHKRNRFIATLPHQAAAAAAATGLIAAAVVPQATASKAEPAASLDADLASTTQTAAQDVIAPSGKPAATLATVKAELGEEGAMKALAESTGGDFSKLTAAQKKGLLSQPLSTVRITSPFGARPDPWGGSGTVGHIGMDYGIQCGTPVHVAAAGTVVQSESAGHSGLRVTVDHGNGLKTTYNHNSELKVKVGDKLSRGDVVSLSGTTGNSTGCHLHFEVYIDDVPVDPADWV